jgi:hypothetical protein
MRSFSNINCVLDIYFAEKIQFFDDNSEVRICNRKEGCDGEIVSCCPEVAYWLRKIPHECIEDLITLPPEKRIQYMYDYFGHTLPDETIGLLEC